MRTTKRAWSTRRGGNPLGAFVSTASSSRWLSVLVAAYYPFLLAVLALLIWLIVILVRVTVEVPAAWWFTLAPLLWLGLTALQLVCVAPWWFARPPEDVGAELRLPAEFLEPIVQLTAGIVRKRGLRMPHDIRLSPDTVAHVYEAQAGERVLVLGGLLVAAVTETALAGVIAHELAHFAAGDTGTLRRAAQRGQTIALLEAHFQGRVSMFFNPFVWLIRLYHLGFALVFLAHSRRQEFAADQYSAQHVGAEETAATLLLLEALDCVPALRLQNIAKDFAARQELLDGIFAEQRRRAWAMDRADWDEACRKAIKRKTDRWSTHPALRDRLKAIDIAPKKAAALLETQRLGRLARELFPAWEGIERVMTEQWLTAIRIEQQLKREAAEIFMGRPIGRVVARLSALPFP
jgi:Zn-dependent protease with chaperone function